MVGGFGFSFGFFGPLANRKVRSLTPSILLKRLELLNGAIFGSARFLQPVKSLLSQTDDLRSPFKSDLMELLERDDPSIISSNL